MSVLEEPQDGSSVQIFVPICLKLQVKREGYLHHRTFEHNSKHFFLTFYILLKYISFVSLEELHLHLELHSRLTRKRLKNFNFVGVIGAIFKTTTLLLTFKKLISTDHATD